VAYVTQLPLCQALQLLPQLLLHWAWHCQPGSLFTGGWIIFGYGPLEVTWDNKAKFLFSYLRQSMTFVFPPAPSLPLPFTLLCWFLSPSYGSTSSLTSIAHFRGRDVKTGVFTWISVSTG